MDVAEITTRLEELAAKIVEEADRSEHGRLISELIEHSKNNNQKEDRCEDSEREAQLQEREEALHAREGELAAATEALEARTKALEEREADVAAQEAKIAAEREQVTAEREQVAAEREQLAATTAAAAASKEAAAHDDGEKKKHHGKKKGEKKDADEDEERQRKAQEEHRKEEEEKHRKEEEERHHKEEQERKKHDQEEQERKKKATQQQQQPQRSPGEGKKLASRMAAFEGEKKAPPAAQQHQQEPTKSPSGRAGGAADLSDAAITSAYKEIREAQFEGPNWMLLGYGDSRNVLSLYGTGSDGLDGLRKAIRPDECQFAYLRYVYGDSRRNKFVLLVIVSESLSGLKKAKASTHKPAIEAFFKVIHITHNVLSMADLSEELIARKIQMAAGANYGGGDDFSGQKSQAKNFFGQLEASN